MATYPTNPIVFVDMQENNAHEIQRVQADASDLLLQFSQNGALPPDLLQQLSNDLQEITNAGTSIPPLPNGLALPPPTIQAKTPPATVDPFYTSARDTLALITGTPVGDEINGLMPSQIDTSGSSNVVAMSVGGSSSGGSSTSSSSSTTSYTPGMLAPAEKQLAAVYGLMENDSLTNPTVSRFVPAVSSALGEYTASQQLFDKVLQVVIQQGQPTPNQITGIQNFASSMDPVMQFCEIRADQWTSVVRTLRGQGVTADDPLLPLKATTILAGEVGGGDNAPPSSIDIDLPDLEAQSDIEIQADNLRGMQAIYFAAQLEELKVFQVVDKLVELFQNGLLPLGKGNAGNTLYDYWKKSINRMTETERHNLYFRTFGFPGGDATAGTPNREFNDLWLRFVSAVSSFARQVTVENLLRTNIPIPVSQQQVKKAARDLGQNLSLHGYGIGYFAATELQSQINQVIRLLADPDIRQAYGARDMWQVVDQVASLELGGARNSIRYRTMASTGAIIIGWLATRATLLISTDQIIVLDVNQLRNLNSLRARGVKATVNPTDRDLVDACDQWLAVTGTADKNVESYAQPIEAPNATSRPVYIPQVARDLLESVGIQAPGQGNGGITRKQ